MTFRWSPKCLIGKLRGKVQDIQLRRQAGAALKRAIFAPETPPADGAEATRKTSRPNPNALAYLKIYNELLRGARARAELAERQVEELQREVASLKLAARTGKLDGGQDERDSTYSGA